MVMMMQLNDKEREGVMNEGKEVKSPIHGFVFFGFHQFFFLVENRGRRWKGWGGLAGMCIAHEL